MGKTKSQKNSWGFSGGTDKGGFIVNFYQLGYYRTGKQGIDAGWKLVLASDGLDYAALNGFKGISANLAELKRGSAVPPCTLGVFQYERFVYIIHNNFAASGSDDRGVTYVHGYCLSLTDHYHLCENPEKLLGIREENYVREYDSSIKEWPVLKELSYDAMDEESLKRKYGLSGDEYGWLVEGAICAIEGLAMPLCIKCTLPLSEYKQVYKELMYLIMKGLPYHMRHRVTGYSFKGSNAVVYLSDTVEGNNYIDLDNRRFVCNRSGLESYGFVQLSQTKNKDNWFKKIAQEIDTVFENAIYDSDIDKIEAIFQENIINEGNPGNVIRLLEFILGCRPKQNEKVNELLKKLLGIINANNLLITDKEAVEQLNIRCGNTVDYDLKQQVCLLNARALINGEKKEGFQYLLNLSHNFPEQHEMLCEALKRQDKYFYTEYFAEIYLPEYTPNLESLLEYLKYNKNLDQDTYRNLLSRTLKIASEQPWEFSDVQELCNNQKIVRKIMELIPEDSEFHKKEYIKKINFYFWKGFNPENFVSEEIELYKACGVEEASKTCHKGEECTNAKKVWELVRLFEGGMTRENIDRLKEVLFSDAILSEEEKERIRRSLLSEMKNDQRVSVQEKFDYSLTLFYNGTENRFDVLEWMAEAKKRGIGMIFESVWTGDYIRHSRVLNDDDLKNVLIDSVKKELRKKRKNFAGKYSRKQQDDLKIFYSYLTGKIEKGEFENRTEEFFFTLHRVPVGMFALSAVAFWIICLQRYTDIEPVIIQGSAIFLGFAGAVAVIIKIARYDSIRGQMERRGLNSALRWLIYTGVFLITAVIISAVLFLPGVREKMTGIFTLSLLSIISVIAYGGWTKK